MNDIIGDCIIWQGYVMPNGYGLLSANPITYAHRWAYEAAKGPIPDGLDIDHLCRNRPCYNADHLEAVTRHENIMRGDGPAVQRARHAARTQCVNGHAFDETNTYHAPDGRRRCQTCRRAAGRRYDRRRRPRVKQEV